MIYDKLSSATLLVQPVGVREQWSIVCIQAWHVIKVDFPQTLPKPHASHKRANADLRLLS